MEAAKYNITIEQGSIFKLGFIVLDSDGTQLDITDKLVRLGVRQTKMAMNEVAQWDLATGTVRRNIYLDTTNVGGFHFRIMPYETLLHDWYTQAYYDITLTDYRADWEVTWCQDRSAPTNGDQSVPNDGTFGTNMTDLLGEVAQTTGTGLDDCAYRGPYSGSGATRFRVIIDGTGTPDTFEWGTVDADGVYTQDTAGINCELLASKVTLQDGIAVYFGATTGHTLSDAWDFAVVAERAGATLSNAIPEAYQFDYNPGIIYPAPAADDADQRAAAKYAKVFRHFGKSVSTAPTASAWIPSHGPLHSDALYVPGGLSQENDDVVITNNLQAHFSNPYFREVQWELQVLSETAGSPGTITFLWRANAGGSSYGTGLTDDSPWIPAGTSSLEYWTQATATKGTAFHLTAGVSVTWEDKTYVSGTDGIADHWFFKTRAPLISIVGSEGSGQHNGIYRMGQIHNNGEGLALTTLITGNAETPYEADNDHDVTARVKNVDEYGATTARSRILEGLFRVKPLVTHSQRHIDDRFPTFI